MADPIDNSGYVPSPDANVNIPKRVIPQQQYEGTKSVDELANRLFANDSQARQDFIDQISLQAINPKTGKYDPDMLHKVDFKIERNRYIPNPANEAIEENRQLATAYNQAMRDKYDQEQSYVDYQNNLANTNNALLSGRTPSYLTDSRNANVVSPFDMTGVASTIFGPMNMSYIQPNAGIPAYKPMPAYKPDKAVKDKTEYTFGYTPPPQHTGSQPGRFYLPEYLWDNEKQKFEDKKYGPGGDVGDNAADYVIDKLADTTDRATKRTFANEFVNKNNSLWNITYGDNVKTIRDHLNGTPGALSAEGIKKADNKFGPNTNPLFAIEYYLNKLKDQHINTEEKYGVAFDNNHTLHFVHNPKRNSNWKNELRSLIAPFFSKTLVNSSMKGAINAAGKDKIPELTKKGWFVNRVIQQLATDDAFSN